jgi:3-oxoacyl-[acyl-carrier-protein] synthase-3
VVPVREDLRGEDNEFFRGVKERRFASPDYLSEDLGTLALQRLLERTGTAAADLDLIICACMFSDSFWPGVGPAIQHRVGAKRATILNIDTSCSSFLSGLAAANAFVNSGDCQTVAVVMVTNFISRLPELWDQRSAAPLGDGAAAALVARGRQSIVARYERSHGEHYGIFRFEPDLVDGQFRNYWERGCGPIHVGFSADMIDTIRENALGLVPQAVTQCLADGGIDRDDVSLLITHQPNEMFVDEWRRRIGIGPPRVHDTLACYGNMFHSSMAVTISDALDTGVLKEGDLVAMGTFSNGGDFVSAMAIRW